MSSGVSRPNITPEADFAEALFDRSFPAFREYMSVKPGRENPHPLRPALAAALRELDAEVGRRVLAGGEPVDLIALADALHGGESRG